MRIDYPAHDQPYAQKKAEGWNGWNSTTETLDVLKTIQELIDRAEIPEEAHVCEIGCGAGNLIESLVQKKWNLTGVDISEVAVNWARERCAEKPIHFMTGDVCQPDLFSENSFDLLIDGLCLHCIIGEDRQKLIANLFRWLKPGGELTILTMCHPPKEKNSQGYDPETQCVILNGLATRYFATEPELLQNFEQAGFQCLFHQVVDPPDDQASFRGLFLKPD